MTQIEYAKNGIISAELKAVAEKEGLDPSFIRDAVAEGTVVITKNLNHNIKNLCGIGKGLRTKVNANIGASSWRGHFTSSTKQLHRRSEVSPLRVEMKKLNTAIKAGADTIMDLSVGVGSEDMLKSVLRESSVPVGTVPIYEVATRVLRRGDIAYMRWNDIEEVLENQAEMGVDFFTVHAGITKEIVGFLKKRERILDVVSRGGSLLIDWMVRNNQENPFYTNFDRILEIAKKFDITLSLGDGMRPGAVKDAGDEAQIHELVVLGRLARRARDFGIQVMIEGPGHVPIDQIAYNVALEKSLCGGAPFYVLGPLVTDVAPGYDHIVAAIGGAIAASAGADFLCYVTASEHLRIPSIADVKEGVIASRIAAHAADIAKGIKGARLWDDKLSSARKLRDWERQFSLAVDPDKPARYRKESQPIAGDVCSMCNEYCPIKRAEDCLKKK